MVIAHRDRIVLERAWGSANLDTDAGVMRDGHDAGQFLDRRPFLSARELKADPQRAAGDRLIIEAITGLLEELENWEPAPHGHCRGRKGTR